MTYEEMVEWGKADIEAVRSGEKALIDIQKASRTRARAFKKESGVSALRAMNAASLMSKDDRSAEGAFKYMARMNHR
jgi:hypothetical protein